jgi:hypothetical protein
MYIGAYNMETSLIDLGPSKKKFRLTEPQLKKFIHKLKEGRKPWFKVTGRGTTIFYVFSTSKSTKSMPASTALTAWVGKPVYWTVIDKTKDQGLLNRGY